MFRTNIPAILQDTFLSNKFVDFDTDLIVRSKYFALLHVRHDLIHNLINVSLDLPSVFDHHETIKEKFEGIVNEEFYKFSPDIFDVLNDKVVFIDISCSYNYEFNNQEKIQKYQPILDNLKSQGFSTLPFYFFWVHPSWHNLEESFELLYTFLRNNSVNFQIVPSILLGKTKLFFEEVSLELDIFRKRLPKELLKEYNIDSPDPVLLSESDIKDFCKERFEHWNDINEALNNSSLTSVEDMFENLVNDKEVREVLKDNKHDSKMYERAFSYLENIEDGYSKGSTKPSFFIPYAPLTKEIVDLLSPIQVRSAEDNFVELRREQEDCLKFLQFYLNKVKSDSSLSLLRLIYDSTLECLDYEADRNIFNTGYITGDEHEEYKLSMRFKEFQSNRKHGDSSVSKRQYYKITGGNISVKEKLPLIYRNKCVKVTGSALKSDFSNESGTSYRKTHEVREYKEKSTICKDEYKQLEIFMDLLETPTEYPYALHDYLGNYTGVDSNTANKLKNMMFIRHNKFLSFISKTNAHSFAKHTSFVASQLLHFNEMRTTDNSFYMFNAGQKNILHIVRGGSQCRGNDVGQAFFTLFITDDVRWASKVYGSVLVNSFSSKGKSYYLCKTPWVRLTSERLDFMKDQYYSTLSTSFDTWSRVEQTLSEKSMLRHVYTFRVCVSSAPSQKVAELLMDTRYIFMSALSKYSNVEDLIKDKFQPPYKNCFEQFIVRQLRKKCSQVFAFLEYNPPKPNKPTYSGSVRLATSLGGIIRIPSLWSEAILPDMQSIFDDLFVYVHTSKEPSSEYHEQIKAMNTILKFQDIYNRTNKQMQSGLGNFHDVKEWLLSGNLIGCNVKTVFEGTKLFSEKYKGLYKTSAFIDSCFKEPLSKIVSTKACVPEYDRKAVNIERSKKEMERIIKNISKLRTDVDSSSVKKTFVKIDVDLDDETEVVIGNSLRTKVHDALLDWVERFGKQSNFVIDLATWNIKYNKGRVLADTCIKAQYGSKREFYVINLGAKAMARVTENSYKVLAKNCKNEMISIPGDRKFEYIQESINNILLASSRRQDKLYFVNGDCTKWSACETMSSFIALNEGMRDVFGDIITNYNNVTFCSWGNKEIQIPNTILKNVKFVTEKTEYLDDTTTIKSTQNFLQGMFNYSSSLKAVIATEFAITQFKRLNPGKFIHVNHLEHSDDYSLCVRTNNDEDFEEFRIYHKLSQKLFGINDSIKKTNIQSHILEFISLFSYNGQLYYPNIKKLKEVGTNLACTDFRSDAMSIISRVSEAVRLGIVLESVYFMQRVHCCSVADAYSISPGMRNNDCTNSERFSLPLELFGLPDSIPILSMLSKGNIENYRLYQFGDESLRRKVEVLYSLGQKCYTSLDLPSTNFDQDLSEMYSPGFSYPVRHHKLKTIRKRVNMTLEDSKKYFEENLTDCLLKPVETSRFQTWLRAMYFNKTFSNAYTRASRSAMTLRHSLFSSKPCMTMLDEDLDTGTVKRNYQTIKHYNDTMDKFIRNSILQVKNKESFLKYISCYSTSPEAFYKVLENCKLISITYQPNNSTVSRMPSPYRWLNLENDISVLLQFIVNRENFYKDRRSFISETSLYRDMTKIEESFNSDLLKTLPSYTRQVFKEILTQKNNQAFGLVFDARCTNARDFTIQYLERGFLQHNTFNYINERNVSIPSLQTSLPEFIVDIHTHVDNYSSLLNQICLLYRVVYLRDYLNLDCFIEKLGEHRPKNMNVTVKEFFQRVNIDLLNTYKLGILSKKIFCYMKTVFCNDYTDLHDFLKSQFYYDVVYLNSKEVPDQFAESVGIIFLGITFKAHRYKTNIHDFVVLEIPNSNRTFWFYCLSIAERAFGMISQKELDQRLVESKDFCIKKVPSGMRYLFKNIVNQRKHTLYSYMGNLIRPESNFEKADLPIITQTVNFFRKGGSKKDFFSLVNINLYDMSVCSGKVVIYKLPFGNLREFDCIDEDFLNQFKIDSIPLGYICKKKNLMNYLKTEYVVYSTEQEMESLFEQAWKGFDKKVKKDYKIKNYLDLFFPKPETQVYAGYNIIDRPFRNINVLEKPKDEEQEVFDRLKAMAKRQALDRDILIKDLEVEQVHLEDEMSYIPDEIFDQEIGDSTTSVQILDKEKNEKDKENIKNEKVEIKKPVIQIGNISSGSSDNDEDFINSYFDDDFGFEVEQDFPTDIDETVSVVPDLSTTISSKESLLDLPGISLFPTNKPKSETDNENIQGKMPGSKKNVLFDLPGLSLGSIKIEQKTESNVFQDIQEDISDFSTSHDDSNLTISKENSTEEEKQGSMLNLPGLNLNLMGKIELEPKNKNKPMFDLPGLNMSSIGKIDSKSRENFDENEKKQQQKSNLSPFEITLPKIDLSSFNITGDSRGKQPLPIDDNILTNMGTIPSSAPNLSSNSSTTLSKSELLLLGTPNIVTVVDEEDQESDMNQALMSLMGLNSKNIGLLNVSNRDSEQHEEEYNERLSIIEEFKLARGNYSFNPEFEFDDIESVREMINLENFEGEEMQELLDAQIENSLDSSSSSSSSYKSEEFIEQDLQITQLLQTGDLVFSGYGFEQRSRKMMVPLNEFLITCWSKMDMLSVLEDSESLSNYILMIVGINKNKQFLNLTKAQKALLKISLKTLKEAADSNRSYYKLTKSRALRMENGKLTVKAMFPFANEDNLIAAHQRNPASVIVKESVGFNRNFQYLALNIKQKDFENFFKQKINIDSFNSRTPFMNRLSSLLPNYIETETELEETYML